jgi:8-oxo-dGTP pyrophosphatase MutT (NUDIX family)
MKIFLNKKSIELTETRPGLLLPDELVIEYTTTRQLKNFIKSFEANDHLLKLLIWSGMEVKRLQKDFFKLFTKIDAAGGVVKNEKGELLFIFRLGKWDLPKGKLSKKETPEDAAIREVKEETGLTHVRILGALPSTFHIYTRKGKQILKQTFWFEMESQSSQPLVPQIEEDITEVKWINVNDLNIVRENTYGTIKQLLEKYESHTP